MIFLEIRNFFKESLAPITEALTDTQRILKLAFPIYAQAEEEGHEGEVI